jgi:hypothetical protein
MYIFQAHLIPMQVAFAPKLVIWDITQNCAIRTFVFPDSVLPWNASFANDIVVDETNGYGSQFYLR